MKYKLNRLSNRKKNQFIKDYQKLIKVKWKKDFIITPAERRLNKFNIFLNKIYSRIFNIPKEPQEEAWLTLMNKLIQKDIKRKKRAVDPFEKRKINCWLKMHKIAIEILKIVKKYKKIRLKINASKNLFLKESNFNNAKIYFYHQEKFLSFIFQFSRLLKKKAQYQNELAEIMTRQKKNPDIKKAILIDFLNYRVSGTKFPIATSAEIIRIFGLNTWLFLFPMMLQTKPLNDVANKLKRWEKIIKKDREELIKKYKL